MVNKKRVLNSHKNRFKSLILPIIIIFLVITLIYLTTPILTENQSTSIINKAFPFLKDIRTQKIFRSPSPPSFVPGTLPTDAELCEGITYNYDVDATDPEIDPLYFSDTTNLFDIDPNSGQITFTPTKAQVGDYRPEDKSVALVVKDPGQEGDLYIWGFIITEVNQQPVLDAITFPQASQHVPFSYQVTATDPEFDTLTYSDDTLLFDINPATGEISFTPSPAQSGSYMINISTCDNSPLIPTLTCPFSQIRCDSKLVTLNIASNNPPQIDSLPSLTATQDMLYNSFLVGSDIDNNPPGTDIITYSENSDMFVINPATGEISFTPLNVNVGNHQIQFNVTDSQGAVISQTVTFQITNVNDNPNITLIFPLNNETIFVYENLSQFFNYTVSDPDFSVDPSEVVADVWSINDIINKTLTGYKTGIEWNGNFTFNPSFDQSNGTFNKTVELKLDIYDTGSINDNETWNVTILNTNLAPVFSGSILNQTWAQNTINNNIHLLDYFSDYDNDRLIFYYNFTDGNDTIINVSIDANGIVTLNPQLDFIGSALIYFSGNDSYLSVDSNVVYLTVYPSNNTVPVPQPVPSSGGGGGGGGGSSSRTKVASLSIEVPPLLTVNPNSTIYTKIKFKNTGDVSLTSIKLSTLTSSIELTSFLQDLTISSLNPSQSFETLLTISAGDITTKENYQIWVNASVYNPKLEESDLIYITSIPTNLTKLDVEILFAIDLFEENSECLELKELIDQAKEKQTTGNNQEAVNIIESAVDSCKQILKESKTRVPKLRTLPSLETFLPIIISLIVLMALVIVILVVMYKHKR